MRRVAIATVAGLFASGPVLADGSDWKPPAVQAATPVPAVPPAAVPAPPAAAAPANPDAPDWNPTRPDGPVWNRVGRSGPTVQADLLPGPIAPAIPIPQIPSAPGQQPAPKKAETLPAPRSLDRTPPQNGGPKPKAEPPSFLPRDTRPAPDALTPTPPTPLPSRVWGGSPAAADCGPVLEPPPGGLGAGGVPVRHKTFGSPTVTLSRDYHFLDLFGIGLLGDDGDTVVLGEGPATDRYFVQAEYLLWWVNSGGIPVLATTGVGSSLGFLGQPGTINLLGPGSFGATARDGFRVRAGAWLDGGLDGCGIDGSFFFLGRQHSTFQVDSTQFGIITRPIFAPNFNQEFGQLVAFPGFATGALRVDQDSLLWGADVNFRSCICRTCESRSEWFAGYRYLSLRENLTISEFIIAGANAPDPAGTRVEVQDRFSTRNQFNGGQVGLAAGRTRGRFDVDARVSVALGATHQAVDISGGQVRFLPGQATPQVFTGGLLAAGPNLGSFSKDKFSVVPEATINVGYMVTPTVRAFVGYNFLYWTNVLRPGDQIDRVVDLTFVPNSPPVAFSGVNRPQPTFRSSDLWAQGLQFGVQLRW